MVVAYITEQGSSLRQIGKRIVVVKGTNTLIDIPVHRLERVLLFGSIQITTQAMALLLDSGIDVQFLNSYGRYKGSLVSGDSKNIFVRMAQHRRWQDKAFKVSFSKSIIEGKIKNQISTLKRYGRNHDEVDFTNQISLMEKNLLDLDRLDDVNQLMGIEGISTSIYFNCFRQMVRGDMDFNRRLKHPSPDPVNALLSLGYILSTNEIISKLDALSYDVFLGITHGIRYGRKSLALDIVEQFRQPLVDRFTLRIINRKVITSEDFEVGEKGASFLTAEAFRRYLNLWEKELSQEGVVYDEKKMTWRKVMEKQCYLLEATFMEGKEYTPFLYKA